MDKRDEKFVAAVIDHVVKRLEKAGDYGSGQDVLGIADNSWYTTTEIELALSILMAQGRVVQVNEAYYELTEVF